MPELKPICAHITESSRSRDLEFVRVPRQALGRRYKLPARTGASSRGSRPEDRTKRSWSKPEPPLALLTEPPTPPELSPRPADHHKLRFPTSLPCRAHLTAVATEHHAVVPQWSTVYPHDDQPNPRPPCHLSHWPLTESSTTTPKPANASESPLKTAGIRVGSEEAEWANPTNRKQFLPT